MGGCSHESNRGSPDGACAFAGRRDAAHRVEILASGASSDSGSPRPAERARRLIHAGTTFSSPRSWESRRPRRRLRRQVRVAGYALLGFLPLLMALTHWTDAQSIRHPGARLLSLQSRPSRGEAPAGEAGPEVWHSVSAATPSLTPVLLSVEPVGTAVDSDTETPVVFPGYLLPDDHHEEPLHEGS